MNTELIRSQARHARLAAFALIGFVTGCDSETGSFNAAASEKAAAEKGLSPGGPTAKAPGKLLRRGRETTETGGAHFSKPGRKPGRD
jgi:hypothetical protein